jgi:hypothetical protein
MCECIERMNLTIAGKMMTDFDRKARKKDPPVLEMLRNVIIASDWATITSPQNEAPTLKQFKSAWTDLASERAKRTRLTVSSGG